MVDPLTLSGPGVPTHIRLPVKLSEQMQAHVQSQAPLEACGLIGGQQLHALGVFPVTNALNSPVRYRMEPQEQVRIFLDLEQRGWDLLAIYHSHPNGPGVPSPTDLAEAAYPEAAHLIWSPQERETGSTLTWHCRAFILQGNTFSEILILDIVE